MVLLDLKINYVLKSCHSEWWLAHNYLWWHPTIDCWQRCKQVVQKQVCLSYCGIYNLHTGWSALLHLESHCGHVEHYMCHTLNWTKQNVSVFVNIPVYVSDYWKTDYICFHNDFSFVRWYVNYLPRKER